MVFRRGLLSSITLGDTPMFGEYRLVAYGVVALELLALAGWIIKPPSRGLLLGLLAGVLGAGALVSFAVGLVMLPLTLLGLLFLIGVLGFVPFVTAFVFLRSASRALARADAAGAPLLVSAAAVMAGFALTLGPAAFAHHRVSAVSQGGQLAAMVDVAREGDVIDLTTLPDQAWERVYVFSPYNTAGSIDKTLGFAGAALPEHDFGVDEGHFLFVFVAGKRVTSHVEWNRGRADICEPGGWHELPRAQAKLAVSKRAGRRRLCPVGVVDPLKGP